MQLLFTTQLTNEAETLALAPPPSPLALRRARAAHAPVQAAPRVDDVCAPARVPYHTQARLWRNLVSP